MILGAIDHPQEQGREGGGRRKPSWLGHVNPVVCAESTADLQRRGGRGVVFNVRRAQIRCLSYNRGCLQ